ncbi:MAG TPA: ATP-binding protein, partial [Paracoccaceae bacterium]|nr:ATP-binding protein [Paracoccaceae bacterium]
HRGMPTGHLPVTSYLAVPVASRSGEVIGGLFFGHAEPARFTERHERLLEGIAGQAAVAIDNARLFESTQREIAERSRAEEALRELNQSLEQRIAAAIAERERAEEALRQAQKMEAVGQLTGGIAHDFNNLLTVIVGNLEMLEPKLGEDEGSHVILREAQEAAELGAQLTERLLAFGRRQPLNPKLVDVGKLVSEFADLLRRTLGEIIQMRTVVEGRRLHAIVDPSQLQNALLNLGINARDAMPNGGRLTIEITSTYLDVDFTRMHPDLSTGLYIMVSVSDTGVGMSSEVRERAFEPFFTTKEVGAGTGLGLSQVYGFAKQSGGHVQLYSEVGHGTTVRLFLPSADPDPGTGTDELEAGAQPLQAQGETILVAEDDHRVRRVTVGRLRALGYGVLEAENGPAALELFRQNPQIALVFTDLVMPGGMTGGELAKAVRAIRPDIKVLFTSGYAEPEIMRQEIVEPSEWLKKPYTAADLARKLREVLQ